MKAYKVLCSVKYHQTAPYAWVRLVSVYIFLVGSQVMPLFSTAVTSSCLFVFADIVHNPRFFFFPVCASPSKCSVPFWFVTQNYWFLPFWGPHLSAPLDRFLVSSFVQRQPEFSRSFHFTSPSLPIRPPFLFCYSFCFLLSSPSPGTSLSIYLWKTDLACFRTKTFSVSE